MHWCVSVRCGRGGGHHSGLSSQAVVCGLSVCCVCSSMNVHVGLSAKPSGHGCAAARALWLGGWFEHMHNRLVVCATLCCIEVAGCSAPVAHRSGRGAEVAVQLQLAACLPTVAGCTWSGCESGCNMVNRSSLYDKHSLCTAENASLLTAQLLWARFTVTP
jgi:hypothetical protein